MLTDEEIIKIKEKMKKKYIYCATLARRWDMSRQCIWAILNKKATSKNLEEKFRKFLNED